MKRKWENMAAVVLKTYMERLSATERPKRRWLKAGLPSWLGLWSCCDRRPNPGDTGGVGNQFPHFRMILKILLRHDLLDRRAKIHKRAPWLVSLTTVVSLMQRTRRVSGTAALALRI
jgi:hypothetical protein